LFRGCLISTVGGVESTITVTVSLCVVDNRVAMSLIVYNPSETAVPALSLPSQIEVYVPADGILFAYVFLTEPAESSISILT